MASLEDNDNKETTAEIESKLEEGYAALAVDPEYQKEQQLRKERRCFDPRSWKE